MTHGHWFPAPRAKFPPSLLPSQSLRVPIDRETSVVLSIADGLRPDTLDAPPPVAPRRTVELMPMALHALGIRRLAPASPAMVPPATAPLAGVRAVAVRDREAASTG